MANWEEKALSSIPAPREEKEEEGRRREKGVGKGSRKEIDRQTPLPPSHTHRTINPADHLVGTAVILGRSKVCARLYVPLVHIISPSSC